MLDVDTADVPLSTRQSLSELDLNISPLAAEIGGWLAERSTTGIAGMTTAGGEAIKEAFPGRSLRDMNKAIAELQAEGLVTTAGGIGREIPQPFATVDLFATFDPVAVGSDPYQDACALIDRILAAAKQADGSSLDVSSPTLREEMEWPLRRFNPALAIVTAHIDDRHVSRSLDGEYTARSFFVTADDELELEQLLARTRSRR